MAVGVYVRVSTEEQRERQSIATQREWAVRYCELHQLAVRTARSLRSGARSAELREVHPPILKELYE